MPAKRRCPCGRVTDRPDGFCSIEHRNYYLKKMKDGIFDDQEDIEKDNTDSAFEEIRKYCIECNVIHDRDDSEFCFECEDKYEIMEEI